MQGYNKTILIGNLTRDVELRHTPKGTAIAEIDLAVNRTWFDKASNSRKEEVTYVSVSAWGRQAEIAAEYLSKGRPVMIEGRLQLDTWDDKTSGEKRSKLKVVCENLQMLGDGRGGSQKPQRQAAAQRSEPEPIDDSFESVPF